MAYSWTPLSNPLASNSDEVVARRKRIDDDLQDLQARMHVLRLERNALCPMYCLSVDLVSRIFLHIKDEYELENGDNADHRGWTTVTQVSRYWRNTALGYSLLWNNIVFDEFNLDTREWLRRARGTQLSVYAQHITARDIPVLNSLLDDLSRIRRLSIPISHQSLIWPRIISKLITSPAPSLEFLRIDDSRYNIIAGPEPCLVPELLFSNDAPRLRELEISGCNLDSKAPFFKNLTQLTLYHCSPPLPLRGFLDILEGTSHLEALRIRNGFTPPFTDQGWQLVDGKPAVFNTISMPSLNSIFIDCPFSPQGLSLLAHLVLKSDTSIEFQGADHNTPFASIIQVDTLIRERSPSTPINCINLTSDPSLLRLKAWSGKTGPTLLKTCLDVPLFTGDHRLSWVAALSRLDLSNLHNFHTNIDIPYESWFTVFGNLRSLRSISVMDAAGPTFINSLIESCPSNDEEVSANPAADFLIPGLQAISLRNVHFRAFSVRGLTGSLVFRRRHGLPFHWITIRDCFNVTTSMVETFRNLGIGVDLDGMEEKEYKGSEVDEQIDAE
ncbi:hypothetical protein BDN72DRAFT_674560 [Pluteus cervinus]|uniref:Uncharacterized protein n=1 Tax=Pluteus cervinus TaxID=181527 RepID=A0ACD3ASD2_9AGAR|nr:hypothetical protein BDN72DRAFT_674560 [Pluteus cervinus]